MKNLSISRKISITATFTAEQWELYEPQCERAKAIAMLLNGRLMNTVHVCETRAEVETAMNETMFVYRDFGACDSEPRFFLRRVLDEIYGED